MKEVLLPSVYAGPVSWYRAFFSTENVRIDVHENYVKQTWRNRCRIAGPNGVQDLVVPVKTEGNHTAVKNVRIDYSESWQRKHWGAITSSYGKSPFFEFYSDRFRPFYFQRDWEMLTSLNHELLRVTLEAFGVKKEFSLTQEFIPYAENDLRKIISPKHKNEEMNSSRYVQVFGERHGFIPGLSVLDLIFCTGPDARNYL
ncbi:MAG TPA: WbqC family protein [Bacteroidia bacterium]|nr:WbqC family protein [Bacteroidia bacterium]